MTEGERGVYTESSGSPLESFFIAGRTLSRALVANLLVSTSFGINAVLYGAWLGYAMGLWALLVQGCWAASFILLSRFAPRVYAATSLHDFLGRRFGGRSRQVAGLLSIIGLMVFIGWEVAIGRGVMLAVLPTGGVSTNIVANTFLFVGVIGAVGWATALGQSGDAKLGRLLNGLKVPAIYVCAASVALGVSSMGLNLSSLLPSLPSAIQSVGVLGVITNIAFNLVWQFVDNSSWQSVCAGQVVPGAAKRALRTSAWLVFVSVGISSTLLGVLLRGFSVPSADGLFAMMADVGGAPAQVAMVLLVVSAVPSLVDRTSLSVAQSLLIDVGVAKRLVDRFPGWAARIGVILVAGSSAWGVEALLGMWHLSIFDFVYILVIFQLALFGPVMMGLMRRRGEVLLGMILGCAVGVGMTLLGGISRIGWMQDAAGGGALVVSFIVCLVMTRRARVDPTTSLLLS